jgi:catechol 2,3-dioxygenase-like lactoylglutathione lyase family enzyme
MPLPPALLGRVVLNVRDLKKSERFYRDVESSELFIYASLTPVPGLTNLK